MSPTTRRRARHRSFRHRSTSLDLAGAALLVAWLGWITFAAATVGGYPTRLCAMLIFAAATLIAARWLSTRFMLLVPWLLVILAGAMALRSPAELLGGRPLSAPFGYANANAAFLVQAAIAGLMIAFAGRRRWLRAAGAIAFLAFATVIPVMGAVAGTALLLVLPAIALVVRALVSTRAAIVTLAGLFCVTLALTIFLGATYRPAGDPARPHARELIDATLTERRLVLWHEAITAFRKHPVLGAGPGNFVLVSATARRDPDTRRAHNAFLQQAAELGAPGFAFLLAAFLWGFARLALGRDDRADSDARPREDGKIAVLAAAALAAAGMHASVDYVLAFPAVTVAAAAMVGCGMGFQTRVRSHRPDPPGGSLPF